MAKRKVIDEDNSIVMIEDNEEDYYFDIPSMRRINYLKRKRAIRLESENRAMLEDIDEAIATARNPRLDWDEDRRQLGLMVVLGGRPGEHWGKMMQRAIHERASRLTSKILRQDKVEGKIVQKKVKTVVVGREYEAPLPDDHDLEREFVEGLKKEKEMGEARNENR